MISALMLFGSSARGDNDENSDVDLLALSGTDQPFSRKVNGIEIQFFTPEHLHELAESGDLFAMHLASEGKVIFDNFGHFDKLKALAKAKPSYEIERQRAFDLAWYLLEFGPSHEPALINKRISWCVRTVVISLLAERGEIAFSPTALSKAFPNHGVPYLINLRRSEVDSVERMSKLRTFLMDFEAVRPPVKSIADFKKYFHETENMVAVSTVRKLESPPMTVYDLY